MTHAPRLILSTHPAAVALLALVVGAGCEERRITQYRVAKTKPVAAAVNAASPSAAPAQPAQKVRIVGAIAPRGEQVWFFKMTGPEQTVAAARPSFDAFIASVRFTTDSNKPLTWQAPEGWTQQPGGAFALAAYKLGPADKAATLTITPLGKEAGDVLGNVNRWRGQVAQPPLTAQDLPKHTTRQTLDGQQAVIVDVTGTGSAGGRPPMARAGPMMQPSPAARPATPTPAPPAGPKYKLPAGWREEAATAFASAAFSAGEGQELVKTTITPMGGGAGGIVANVNRWRTQAGLDPLDEAGVQAMAQRVKVDNHDALRFDIIGKTLRIVVTLLPHDEVMWFFRMSGTPQAVEKQRAAYETFINSVVFDGGHHG